jgi:hypothetical protein
MSDQTDTPQMMLGGTDFDAEEVLEAVEQMYDSEGRDPVEDGPEYCGDTILVDDGFDDRDVVVFHYDDGYAGTWDYEYLRETAEDLLDDEMSVEAIIDEELSHAEVVAAGDETDDFFADAEIVDEADETEMCYSMVHDIVDSDVLTLREQYVDDDGRLVTALLVDD